MDKPSDCGSTTTTKLDRLNGLSRFISPLLCSNSHLLAIQANTKETTDMLKQLLTGSFILSLLLVNSLSAQAKKEPRLQSQVQDASPTTPAPNGSMTSPGSDGSMTTPVPNGSMTSPGSNSSNISSGSGSNKRACESIPPARPSGGATRQRLQAIQSCK